MDKYEYKVRADEIKELIAYGEYAQAAEIADTIDWRRVKSVMMLCTISDLYKINRRYEDAKNMLLLAYERRPGGRTICYSLCELCIKTEEFVQAVEYYKEFVQVAPKDSGRYILQYKLYEAQDVSLEERIGVLEELKKRDYREKWAYELAYLYHRVGLATRCVEECDELILWFGEGKYVIKAMELKMLHQPLTAAQQERYDHRFDTYVPLAQDSVTEQSQDQYTNDEPAYEEPGAEMDAAYESETVSADTLVYENIRRAVQEQVPVQENVQETVQEQPEELDIHVKTMDMGQYNTINLQAELAAGLREVLGDEQSKSAAITRSIVAPMMDTESLDYPELEDEDISENDVDEGIETIESTEVFFGETGEVGVFQKQEPIEEPSEEIEESELSVEEETVVEPEQQPESQPDVRDITAEIVMNQLRMESADKAEEQVMIAQPPKELAGVLSQESDGQISLVMPELETVEKQITGQMNIEDVLAEWERLKQESQERREEEVRQRVLQQTGNMFTEFDESVRDGLLEQLENETVEDIPEEESVLPEESDDFPEDEERAELEEEIDEEAEFEEEAEIDEEAEFEEEAEADEEAEFEEEAEADEEAEFEEEAEIDEEAAEVEPDASEDFGEVEELEEIQEEFEESEEGPAEEPTEEPTEGSAEEPEETQEPPSAPEPSTEDAKQPSVEREKPRARALTQEEKELFAPYIQSKSAKEQLVTAIDNISLAAYTGNIIITGDEGMDTMTLAKNIIREVQLTDSNFSGKVAKISGEAMNQKNVAETLKQLKNGALIIHKASGMNHETAMALYRELQRESLGIIIVMEDTKRAINKLLDANKELDACFTARMNVEAMSNDMLAAFGRQYAKEMEYMIDDLGVLALHTRIDELQTIDHAVTVLDVKRIVDEAIHHANRKTVGHFVDILLARRYDEEDMIILTEKDFA